MQEFLQQRSNGLSVGSIYALIAVGYTMVYGVLQLIVFFFFQAEDGIRDLTVTGVQTCALPICGDCSRRPRPGSRVDPRRCFRDFYEAPLRGLARASDPRRGERKSVLRPGTLAGGRSDWDEIYCSFSSGAIYATRAAGPFSCL